MSAIVQYPLREGKQEILAITQKACLQATRAAEHTIDMLHSPSAGPLQAVTECEEQLDVLDRELDDKIHGAILAASPAEVQELLTCMKFMIDLERIGDLLWSFVGRMRALNTRLPMNDVRDLLTMGLGLQKMLVDVYQAFSLRDIDRAISVLRADSEIDRFRNLIFFRHVENREGMAGEHSIHVLFMTQALERAGDHVKNMAEEVCHLITGHSLRHVLRELDKPHEQLYLEYLRRTSEAEESV